MTEQTPFERAMDEVQTLRAELERLREALRRSDKRVTEILPAIPGIDLMMLDEWSREIDAALRGEE